MSTQQIAVAALGALHPGDVVVEGYRPESAIGGFVTVRRGRGDRMNDRHWHGEAVAAFDQALANAPQDAAFGQPELWLQRAQVAAQIAAAEQARIANLIAWKALRQSAPATALGGSGDAITDEIEAALGIPGDVAPPAGLDAIPLP